MTNHKIFCTVLVEIQIDGYFPHENSQSGGFNCHFDAAELGAKPEAVERFARSRYWPQDLRELRVPQFGIAKLVRS